MRYLTKKGKGNLPVVLFLFSLGFLGGCDTPNGGSGTDGPKPDAPANLAARPGNSQIALSWAAVSGASLYHIYRSISPGSTGTLVGSTGGTSYTDTGLSNGTLYYYRLTAVTPAGESSASGQLVSAPTIDRSGLAHGADVSWITWLEHLGVTWSDASGVSTPPEALLKGLGLDSIRLRVMVNPSTSTGVGYADTASVVQTAQRCVAAGLTRVMIDFHLSDTWADPSHQAVPAAWAADAAAELAAHVAGHVTSVLTALEAQGITPEWVQMGNEETQGVLWPNLAKVSGTTGWGPLATVLNAGYDAVKAVDSSILVILHLDRGGQSSLYQWWFDNYSAAGGKWDVIGLSFYPYWQPGDTVAMLQANLNSLATRYSKPVMVVEVGGPETEGAGTQALLARVKNAVASVPGSQGLGVFYWEPDSNASVTGYALGATKVRSGMNLQFTTALLGLGWTP
jgi:arabinogalactan endo-1,4-beta-galactosidase